MFQKVNVETTDPGDCFREGWARHSRIMFVDTFGSLGGKPPRMFPKPNEKLYRSFLGSEFKARGGPWAACSEQLCVSLLGSEFKSRESLVGLMRRAENRVDVRPMCRLATPGRVVACCAEIGGKTWWRTSWKSGYAHAVPCFEHTARSVTSISRAASHDQTAGIKFQLLPRRAVERSGWP